MPVRHALSRVALPGVTLPGAAYPLLGWADFEWIVVHRRLSRKVAPAWSPSALPILAIPQPRLPAVSRRSRANVTTLSFASQSATATGHFRWRTETTDDIRYRPEYNHGPSAVLKNAFDWVDSECHRKAARLREPRVVPWVRVVYSNCTKRRSRSSWRPFVRPSTFRQPRSWRISGQGTWTKVWPI